MEEKELWKGHPSQIVNLGTFILCFLLSPLIVPIFIALWKYLQTRHTKYEITDQRIVFQTGVFSRTTDELELYRIKDIRLEEPFFLRLFGLSNILLSSSDVSHPDITIAAISEGKQTREQLRKAIEARRDLKKVREIDY